MQYPRICLFTATVLLTALQFGCGEDVDEDVRDTGTIVDTDIPSDLGPTDAATLDAAPDADMSDDAGAPCTDPTVCRTPQEPGVSPDGHSDVDTPLADGEVRAGRITSGDTGFRGVWAHCRTGDFKLYNSRVAFCVQNETTNRLETFTGGTLVDAAPVDYQAEDVFDVFKPRADLNLQFTESVEVIRDGSGSSPAVIRVTGKDMPIGHFVGVIGPQFFQRLNISITTEYRLAPDSDHLEIVTWYGNDRSSRIGFQTGDWLGFGDRSAKFRPRTGFDLQSLERFRWIGAYAPGVSFAWAQPGEPAINFQVPFDNIPWVLTESGGVGLDPDEEHVFRRWLVVGDGSLDQVRRRALELVGDTEDRPLRNIRVVDSQGSPIPGRRVMVSDVDGPVTADDTDANGEVEFALAPAQYDVIVQPAIGEVAITDVADFTSASDHQITVQRPGTLRVTVTDAGDGSNLTARLRITGPATADFVALRGTGEIQLAPGTYHVVATHGMEFDYDAADVTITAGDQTDLTLSLLHSVDTTGWISGDFHQHMEPSPDSEALITDRILDNLAQGVEFATSTDHDVVTDLQPYIDELGVDDLIDTYTGVEISPAYTHIGLFPVPYRPDERGRGSIPLGILENEEPARRTIPEVIEIARQMETNPLVQVNHGREGSGLFGFVQYDPTTDPGLVESSEFTTDFDTMEIINRFDSTCILFADWSGFLNSGYRKTGMGNSDTHGLWGDSGHPRNFLRIASQPGEVTGEEVREALVTQQVTVAANAFIDFGDGRIPGDIVSANASEDLDFHVRVQTPNWSEATKMVVIVNGEAVESFDLNGGSPPFDFNGVITRSFSKDSWIVFYAWGPEPAGEVRYGDPVIAFTNPLYVDVDGDSDSDGDVWEAPGAGSLDLQALNFDDYCN